MQHEVTMPQDLLDPEGVIIEEGWARHPVWTYHRDKIAASWLRIKEWDYYYILSHDKQIGLTVTVSDLGYAGSMAVCFLDFSLGTATQFDTLVPLTRGNLHLPPASTEGTVHFSNKQMSITITTEDHIRKLSIAVPGFSLSTGESGLTAELTLTQPSFDESINIATSWKENRKAFYLNEKITCMPVTGTITVGNRSIRCSPQTDFAGLDWGRGRWTYRNRWYWGSTSGTLDGVPFGFNVGYGFSDRTPATENVLFYDHTIHKLNDIDFIIDTSDYMRPWKFTSSDSRFELEFTPIVDRQSKTNLFIIQSIQHQVFGYFSGRVILDSGEVLQIENLLGFAEDVKNYW